MPNIETIPPRETTNEEAAAELILDYLMNDGQIAQYLNERVKVPAFADMPAEDTPEYNLIFSQQTEWHSHVLALAVTKLRNYNNG